MPGIIFFVLCMTKGGSHRPRVSTKRHTHPKSVDRGHRMTKTGDIVFVRPTDLTSAFNVILYILGLIGLIFVVLSITLQKANSNVRVILSLVGTVCMGPMVYRLFRRVSDDLITVLRSANTDECDAYQTGKAKKALLQKIQARSTFILPISLTTAVNVGSLNLIPNDIGLLGNLRNMRKRAPFGKAQKETLSVTFSGTNETIPSLMSDLKKKIKASKTDAVSFVFDEGTTAVGIDKTCAIFLTQLAVYEPSDETNWDIVNATQQNFIMTATRKCLDNIDSLIRDVIGVPLGKEMKCIKSKRDNIKCSLVVLENTDLHMVLEAMSIFVKESLIKKYGTRISVDLSDEAEGMNTDTQRLFAMARNEDCFDDVVKCITLHTLRRYFSLKADVKESQEWRNAMPYEKEAFKSTTEMLTAVEANLAVFNDSRVKFDDSHVVTKIANKMDEMKEVDGYLSVYVVKDLEENVGHNYSSKGVDFTDHVLAQALAGFENEDRKDEIRMRMLELEAACEDEEPEDILCKTLKYSIDDKNKQRAKRFTDLRETLKQTGFMSNVGKWSWGDGSDTYQTYCKALALLTNSMGMIMVPDNDTHDLISAVSNFNADPSLDTADGLKTAYVQLQTALSPAEAVGSPVLPPPPAGWKCVGSISEIVFANFFNVRNETWFTRAVEGVKLVHPPPGAVPHGAALP